MRARSGLGKGIALTERAGARRLRLAFQKLFDQPRSKAHNYLADWLETVLNSGVDALENFFQKRDLILAWVKHKGSTESPPK